MTFAGKTKTELGQFQFMRLRLFRQLLAELLQFLTAPLDHRREPRALAVGRRYRGRAFALESRHQRFALAFEFSAKLSQCLLMRMRCRGEFMSFAFQIALKLGHLGFSCLQQCLQRFPFIRAGGSDIEVPVELMLECFAFGFQRVGVLGDGFVLVPPELLFILCRGQTGRQSFQPNGGVMQKVGVVPDRHHVGKAPEKMRRLRDIGRLRRHGGVRHEACFPEAPERHRQNFGISIPGLDRAT